MAGGYVTVREDYCRETANYLTRCFTFSTSPEGGNFWNAIHDRLNYLGHGQRFTEPCVKVMMDDTERVKLLLATIEERDKEIASLSTRLVAANNKLMISDWVNHSLPRGSK